MPLQPLHLRPELRLQGRRLRLQPGGPPLIASASTVRSPPRLRTPSPPKEPAMRMLWIIGSSLALTLALRIVDPPPASAAPYCGDATARTGARH